ncbi:MAG: flagellar biosynthesis protein FlhF [Deferrisomatales bacterium]
MRVKKYQAVDMAEALRQIKEELGPEAVILSTRQIKPGRGVFGMLGRPLLEVTAAADIDVPRPRPAPAPPRRPAPAPDPAPSRQDHATFLALHADIESLREELMVLSRQPRAAGEQPLVRDVRALSEKIDRLLEQTAPVERFRFSPPLRKLHAHLTAIDLDANLADRILTFLQGKVDAGVVPEGSALDAFRQLVRQTVRVSGELVAGGEGPKVVAFVGPTGVGKTTTVAKLAARFALQERRRVGLITVDTFRIAAIEQLKTYAKIMGVPIRIAADAAAFAAAVQDLADRDLVLVDTAGQSPRDEESLLALLGLFPEGVQVEVHLVLSVTTRTRDLDKILRHYEPVRASRLLLTKLDETDCLGAVLGLPLGSRLPLSYLTTGQNVPDDIEPATPARVADCLLRGLGTTT